LNNRPAFQTTSDENQSLMKINISVFFLKYFSTTLNSGIIGSPTSPSPLAIPLLTGGNVLPSDHPSSGLGFGPAIAGAGLR
jgi:hypothetical protein